MRDGIIRRAVKLAARCVYGLGAWIYDGGNRIVFKPQYELGGACARTGQCCVRPRIKVGYLTQKFVLYRRLWLWWQRVVNGFIFDGEEDGGRLHAFICTHYDAETRSCDSYDSRPGMCRHYPRLLLNQVEPNFHPGCGYRAVNVYADQLKAKLKQLRLDEEKVRKLEKDLHVE